MTPTKAQLERALNRACKEMAKSFSRTNEAFISCGILCGDAADCKYYKCADAYKSHFLKLAKSKGRKK